MNRVLKNKTKKQQKVLGNLAALHLQNLEGLGESDIFLAMVLEGLLIL